MSRLSRTFLLAAILAGAACAQDGGALLHQMFPSAAEMSQGVNPRLLAQFQEYSQQVTADPHNVAAITNRGTISLTISRHSVYEFFWLYLAARDMEHAIQLAPNDFYARHNYAEVCFRYGDAPNDHSAMNLAISNYTRAIQIRPSSARSYMGRSWAYLMLNDQAHFEADARKALQLDPSLQSDMNKEVNGIAENKRQGSAAREVVRRMGTYYVEKSARTANQCAAYKGYWTNSECRISTALNPGS